MSLHAGTRRTLLSTQAPVAGGWWLSGGIAAANCLAAYTPKGAASLAASYDNNAAPGNGLPDGTYDAGLGVAPTFNAAIGWTFNGTTQYLTTGIVPASGYSCFARFANGNVTDRIRQVFGVDDGAGKRFGIRNYQTGVNKAIYHNGGQVISANNYASGVIGIAGAQGYYNGATDSAAISAWVGVTALACYVAAANSGGITNFFGGDIIALALYNVTLSAPQVAALSVAMAAL